ncbi:MAG: DNA primase [SAR324 cluster bacterium]|nr:DNA primase [SAR324 cluster bacterium]
MALSRDTVAAVKERADIVEVIGDRVHLTPSGADFIGLCPFHGEKTPSFRVSPSRRAYHCFGCGAGGSVIDFLMAAELRSFGEAVAELAERYGVPLPDAVAQSAADRSQEALQAARGYYHECLMTRPEGEQARVYLSERGFDEADWTAFQVGFARDQWQGFTDFGLAQGFSREDLLATGLVRQGETGRAYDMLRKRVVFPILNERGRPIAFGGRVIDPLDSPKYLNTPETRHYHKGRVLFGLSQALPALRAERRVVLVEGYLDVLRLHRHGIREAVATCGTALSEEHLRVLERYAERAILLFDGDEAGVKAALRCAPLFLNHGIEARVAVLPGGADPDEFLRHRGEDAFAELLEQAGSILEFLVFQLLARNGSTLRAKEKTLEELAPILAQVRKPAARDLTVRYLADLTGVRAEAILRMVQSSRQRNGQAAPDFDPPAVGGREGRHARRVLRILLEERGLVAQVRQQLRPEELMEPDLRALLEHMLALPDEELRQLAPEGLMEKIPDLAPTIRALMMDHSLHVRAWGDLGRQMESDILSIKEDLKNQLFQKLKQTIATLADQNSSDLSEGEVAAMRELRNAREPLNARFRFRRAFPPRPELRLKEAPLRK